MKKIFVLLTAAVALFSAASCQKSPVEAKDYGYLSFGEFSLDLDETVETRAAANGNYVIIVSDSEGREVVNTTYGNLQTDGNYMITLPAGDYTLEARSTKNVPTAEFEQPVYGTSADFSITAGETTVIGELVCTLLQCKVTVAYSDEFLASVTGAGKTTVEVTAGSPLEYALNANGAYDQSAGYFAVNGNTMEVVFSGNIEGKSQKMTKTFTNIAPRQWRQIKFVKKVNEQGNAVFDIVINDLVDDEILNNSMNADEEIIGEDPDAPKGDGGITLTPDYEGGCDSEITDLQNIRIVPTSTRKMAIRFRATVPNGVKKFNVMIDSESSAFLNAVDAANARQLDLINPLPENGIIFDVVPFPHGQELLGQTDIAFNLDAAQEAITIYPGRHTFKMVIVDQTGCKNEIPVVMVVE
jgi:hypothetical protein